MTASRQSQNALLALSFVYDAPPIRRGHVVRIRGYLVEVTKFDTDPRLGTVSEIVMANIASKNNSKAFTLTAYI